MEGVTATSGDFAIVVGQKANALSAPFCRRDVERGGPVIACTAGLVMVTTALQNSGNGLRRTMDAAVTVFGRAQVL